MRNPVQTLTDLARTALAGDDPAAVCNVLYIGLPNGAWGIEVAAGTEATATAEARTVRFCMYVDANDHAKGCVAYATIPAAEKAMQHALMRYAVNPPAPVAEPVAAVEMPTETQTDPETTFRADLPKTPVEGE